MLYSIGVIRILFNIIFIIHVEAKYFNQDFPLLADTNDLYVIPIFSENSTIEDFKEAYFFLIKLPNLPILFDIYCNHTYVVCYTLTDYKGISCSGAHYEPRKFYIHLFTKYLFFKLL